MATCVYPAVAFRVLRDAGDTPWFALFPDLPGCFPAADSLEQLAAAAADAGSLHLQDVPRGDLPAPSTYAQVAPDAVAEAHGIDPADAEAVTVLLIPVSVASKAVRVNITLDEGLLARIDRAASRFSGGRSGLLAEGARRLLAEEAGTRDDAA